MTLNSRRVHHSPSHTISCPVNLELAPCMSSQTFASPPKPPHGHKHSLSKPMIWLSRSSSAASSRSVPHAQAAPRPTRISEPKVGSSLEQVIFYSNGSLGSGATIVRTPQEALATSFHCALISEEDGEKYDVLLHSTEKNEEALPPLPPASPPLPPLPDIPGEGEARWSSAATSVPSSDHALRPCSSSSTSYVAQFSSSRPTLVAHSPTPSRSVTALPIDADASPPQPTFEAILLSSIPDGPVDPSKLVVTLETCTSTYRTTLRSLVSRPSHLSCYLTSLLLPVSETVSLYSNVSDASFAQQNTDFSSLFRDHLASSGCLSQSFAGIHIFLDRPSAPYAHILTYLRTLPGTAEHPGTLPRAVQLGPDCMSHSRLESLLELWDEAAYLGLVELEELCCHEIARFQRVPPQASQATSPGIATHRDKVGSLRSCHMAVDEWEQHQLEVAQLSEHQVSKSGPNAESITRKSTASLTCEKKDISTQARCREKRSVKYEVGTPPPGWL